MKTAMLTDWQWKVKIEYKDYPDSILYISSINAVDVLSAIAETYRHVKERYPFEIISIEQEVYNHHKIP